MQTSDDMQGPWQQMLWFDTLHSDSTASASQPQGGGFTHMPTLVVSEASVEAPALAVVISQQTVNTDI